MERDLPCLGKAVDHYDLFREKNNSKQILFTTEITVTWV